MLVLPSKELLSEVLGIKCTCYKEIGDDGIIYPLVHYGFVKGIEQVGNAKQYPKGINIYELVHKNLKEWASNNQFTLVSGDSGHGFVCSVGHYSNNAINAEFYGENEFNAVIQGCEYILKEHHATN